MNERKNERLASGRREYKYRGISLQTANTRFMTRGADAIKALSNKELRRKKVTEERIALSSEARKQRKWYKKRGAVHEMSLSPQTSRWRWARYAPSRGTAELPGEENEYETEREPEKVRSQGRRPARCA